MKLGSDFSMEVLKFVKLDNRKTRCFGHGRRIMFLLPGVFESGFQKNVHRNEKNDFRNIRLTDPINRL